MSADETRVLAAQEGDHVGDVLGPAEPAQRSLAFPSQKVRYCGICSNAGAVIGVSIAPGCTHVAVTPNGPSSAATERVSPSTACLDAE